MSKHQIKGESNRFYERFINPETRYKAIDVVYMIYALLMMFHHIYTTAYYTTAPRRGTLFFIPWCVFAVLSLILGRMWKDKGYWLLTALQIIKIVRMAAEYIIPDLNLHYLSISLYAFWGCYCVGRAIRPNYRKIFLELFCSIWTVAVTVLACLGLYVAWTGTIIYSNNVELVYILDHRLNLLDHPVTTGVMISLSIAIAMIECHLTSRKWVKVLCIIAIVIMFIAGGLTATRTSYIVTAAETGLLICLCLFSRFKPILGKQHYHIKPKQYLAICGTFLLIMVSLVFIQMNLINLFNGIREKGSIITVAHAEQVENSAAVINTREFETEGGLNSLLTGRLGIWKSVVETIGNDPQILLYGLAQNEPMTPVTELRASQGLFKAFHCHNMYLQTLLENGIPGLLLFLGFIVYILKHSYSLGTNVECPMWQRILIIPVIGCVIESLVDCSAHTNYGYPQMTAFYLFAGMVVAFSQSNKLIPAERQL